MNTPSDVDNKYTCLRLGKHARLFVKNIRPEISGYMSEFQIEFYRTDDHKKNINP
jgi:hypothetical protein